MAISTNYTSGVPQSQFNQRSQIDSGFGIREGSSKGLLAYFVDVNYNFDDDYWQDGFTKAKIDDNKWLDIDSEEFQQYNESKTIPSLPWTAPIAPTSEQIILKKWESVNTVNYNFSILKSFSSLLKKHGRGNENHDFVWREYLTNPLLTNPGAWAGGIKASLPDNFFDEEHFPTYDYKDIDRFIEHHVMINGWLDENEYIKTNLYRWNETHFWPRKQGKVS